MFSNLRQGSPFYVLKKGETPSIGIGSVVSVSAPKAKYNTQSFSPQNMMEMVVDVTVKMDDETLNLEQLPSNQSIVNFGQQGMVVSESKEAMVAEVESMKRMSEDILSKIDFHAKTVEECDKMLKVLNPQYAKEVARDEEMSVLKAEVGEIKSSLSNMEELLVKVLNVGNTNINKKKNESD